MHPWSKEVKKCPYPHYDQWRRKSPILWNDEMGAWLVLSYKEAVFVLENSDIFSSTNSVFSPQAENVETFPSIINIDEPRHWKLRALAAQAFTPKNIKGEWVDRIQRIVDEQLDGVQGDRFYAVRDLAYPVPVRVIAEIIGVESEKFEAFKRWSDAIIKRIGVPIDQARNHEEFQQAIWGLSAYYHQQIELRRQQPRDDLLTRLVEAEVDGEKLTQAELQAFLVLLLVAGNETTTNLMAQAIRALAENPELMRRVRGDRSLVPKLIEETVRWESPIQGFYRKATRDVEVAGKLVKKGDPLCVLYAAANRDPAKFPDPDEHNIDRATREHVAFGRGIHFCLGANLARTEAGIAINSVLDRFEALAPLPGFEVEWTPAHFMRGPVEYPVIVTRAAASVAAAG